MSEPANSTRDALFTFAHSILLLAGFAGFTWSLMATLAIAERGRRPLWLAAAVASAAIIAIVFRSFNRLAVRRQRAFDHRCVVCGYDVRASPDRCPECGMPVAK